MVVLDQAQSGVLELLHDTYIGISRMKSLARQFVWWPSMDTDTEQHVKNCVTCQVFTKDPPTTPLHPWEWPQAPPGVEFMQILLVHSYIYLILIDAHSKWLEVHITSGGTSTVTINKMKLTFSTLGLPDILVTDNGPAFYKPKFFQFYEGQWCPATFGRHFHSHLDLLRPELSSKVCQKQNNQKQVHNHQAQEHNFTVDDKVFTKNHAHGSPWLPGVILSKSDTSLLIKLKDDSVIAVTQIS